MSSEEAAPKSWRGRFYVDFEPGDVFRSRLGLTIRYVIEETPLGTAGALKNILGIAAGICDGLAIGDNGKAEILRHRGGPAFIAAAPVRPVERGVDLDTVKDLRVANQVGAVR